MPEDNFQFNPQTQIISTPHGDNPFYKLWHAIHRWFVQRERNQAIIDDLKRQCGVS